MNDLLNEEEFLPKEYNPKRRFRKFYVGAFLVEVAILLLFRYAVHFSNSTVSILVGISNNFILPLALSLIMIFGKKEVLLNLPKSKILTGILILHSCYLIPLIANSLKNFYEWIIMQGFDQNYWLLLIPLATLAINFGLSVAITIPIVNRARKIRNLQLPQ